MKKATTTFKLASVAVAIAASAFLASCSGDDGAVGPAGKDGTNGTNGTNGVGFDDAITRGNILVILDGKRPDGVAFKDTLNFRFAPSSPRYSYFSTYSEGDTYTDVYAKRYQSWDGSGDPYNDETTGTVYTWTTAGLEGTKLTYQSLEVDLEEAYVEFPAEKKYFELNVDSYISNYLNSETGVWENNYSYNFGDSTITSVDTKVTNGAYKYNFTYVVPANNNSTGYDLKMTAIADLKLDEQMYNPNGKRTQNTSSNGRAAGSVAKAVMKSME